MSELPVTFQNYEQPCQDEDEIIEIPTRIGKENICANPINPGETEIILQRHGRYIRDRHDKRVGSLTNEARDAEAATARGYFEALLGQVPNTELNNVNILFVASDTDFHGGGQRSYETAVIAQDIATQLFIDTGISTNNILNASHSLKGNGGPRPTPKLREPQMFSKSPGFVEFLKDKYGNQGQEFWLAFEEDAEHETRQAMGAEGPAELADRANFSIRALSRYAKMFHTENPGKRLIIWADSHYDTISPFVKRDVLGVGKESMLTVDYGAGITIDIDGEGNGRTMLGGQAYAVPTR